MLYQSRKVNNVRIVAVSFLIVASFVSYNFFFMQQAGAQDITSDATAPVPAAGVTDAENAVISKITSINLDSSFLRSPAFVSLTDRTVTIPELPAGKTNPFAPLPGSTKQPTSSKK